MQVLSYQIADSIDIKSFKNSYKAQLHYSDADELFYKTNEEGYVYVFKYGVVCFLNCDAGMIIDFLQLIAPFCRNLFQQHLSEEYQININSNENRFGFNSIEIVRADIDT